MVFLTKKVSQNSLHFWSNNSWEHKIWGQCFNIYTQKYERDIKRFYFTWRISQMWNNLSCMVMEALTLNTLKNSLDSLWQLECIVINPNVKLNKITPDCLTRLFKNWRIWNKRPSLPKPRKLILSNYIGNSYQYLLNY